MAKRTLDKATLVKLGLPGVFAGGLLLFFLLGSQHYVSFEAIKESREALLDYKRAAFLAGARLCPSRSG